MLQSCATTKQVLLATEDQVGSYYPDIFTNIHYSYIDDSSIVICVDALRQQKNLLTNGYHHEDMTYEFTLAISELNKIQHSSEPLNWVRETYLIPRDNITECKIQTLPLNVRKLKIRGVNLNTLRNQGATGKLLDINLKKVLNYTNEGGMLVTNTRELVYVSKGPNLTKIKTNNPITPGSPVAYVLVPFTVVFDIVAFPFRAIGVATMATH